MLPKDSDFVMNKLQNLRESALKDGLKPNMAPARYSQKATPGNPLLPLFQTRSTKYTIHSKPSQIWFIWSLKWYHHFSISQYTNYSFNSLVMIFQSAQFLKLRTTCRVRKTQNEPYSNRYQRWRKPKSDSLLSQKSRNSAFSGDHSWC